MKREYGLSIIIISLGAALLSFIALINEDISVKLFMVPFFSFIAFAVSSLGVRFSEKMIGFGDRMQNGIIRFFYYICLLVGIIVIVFLGYLFIDYAGNLHETSNSLSEALSWALLIVLLEAVFAVTVFIPYIQTIIILVLRKIINKNGIM